MQLTVQLDDIAFHVDSGLICGYIKWQTPRLQDIQGWVLEHGTLWITDIHGPVYFETNSSVIGHHTIKAWHAMVCSAAGCVFLFSDLQIWLNDLSGNLPTPLEISKSPPRPGPHYSACILGYACN